MPDKWKYAYNRNFCICNASACECRRALRWAFGVADESGYYCRQRRCKLSQLAVATTTRALHSRKFNHKYTDHMTQYHRESLSERLQLLPPVRARIENASRTRPWWKGWLTPASHMHVYAILDVCVIPSTTVASQFWYHWLSFARSFCESITLSAIRVDVFVVRWQLRPQFGSPLN